MNFGKFDLVELLTVIEIWKDHSSELTHHKLKDIILSSQIKVNSFISFDSPLKPKIDYKYYVDILIKRNLLSFDSVNHIYEVLQKCSILGKAFFDITSGIPLSTNFEIFSSLINKIHDILINWNKLLVDSAKNLETDQQSLFQKFIDFQFELQDYYKLSQVIRQLNQEIFDLIQSIREMSSKFKSQFIKSLYESIPVEDLKTSIDNYIRLADEKLNKIYNMNNEFNNIITSNSALINKIESISEDLFFKLDEFSKNLVIEDNSYTNMLETKDFIAGLNKFFSNLEWKIKIFNQKKLESILNLIKNLKSLIEDNQLIGIYYSIWYQGINLMKENRADNWVKIDFIKNAVDLTNLRRHNIRGVPIEEFIINLTAFKWEEEIEISLAKINENNKEKYIVIENKIKSGNLNRNYRQNLLQKFILLIRKKKKLIDIPKLLFNFVKEEIMNEQEQIEVFLSMFSRVYSIINGKYTITESNFFEIKTETIEFNSGFQLQYKTRLINLKE